MKLYLQHDGPSKGGRVSSRDAQLSPAAPKARSCRYFQQRDNTAFCLGLLWAAGPLKHEYIYLPPFLLLLLFSIGSAKRLHDRRVFLHLSLLFS